MEQANCETVAARFLARPVTDAEMQAMEAQVERAVMFLADHPAGRHGRLFGAEPSDFDAVMQGWLRR